MTKDELSQLSAALNKVKSMTENIQSSDEKLGDIPTEFLDPILSTLMRDPVILPDSKQRIERSVISRHLLNDRCDPFTRTPLSPEMLIPDEDLKRRIDEFIESRLGKTSSE